MKQIEDIELSVRNEHSWFELDEERLRGFILALQNQGVITNETAVWIAEQILQLETHFKGLEIQYYKMKDIAKGGK